MIDHIYACLCGAETPCEAKDLERGRVFQCPACKEVCARVIPKGGGSAWITVGQRDVEFYDLLDFPAKIDDN